jgi:hypothetical protein
MALSPKTGEIYQKLLLSSQELVMELAKRLQYNSSKRGLKLSSLAEIRRKLRKSLSFFPLINRSEQSSCTWS